MTLVLHFHSRVILYPKIEFPPTLLYLSLFLLLLNRTQCRALQYALHFVKCNQSDVCSTEDFISLSSVGDTFVSKDWDPPSSNKCVFAYFYFSWMFDLHCAGWCMCTVSHQKAFHTLICWRGECICPRIKSKFKMWTYKRDFVTSHLVWQQVVVEYLIGKM